MHLKHWTTQAGSGYRITGFSLNCPESNHLIYSQKQKPGLTFHYKFQYSPPWRKFWSLLISKSFLSFPWVQSKLKKAPRVFRFSLSFLKIGFFPGFPSRRGHARPYVQFYCMYYLYWLPEIWIYVFVGSIDVFNKPFPSNVRHFFRVHFRPFAKQVHQGKWPCTKK